MKHSKLIDALNNCAAHCNYCADACLDEGDIKMMVDCIRTDRACAEICSATANLLASNYSDVSAMVEQCRDICKKCADVCDKHDHKHCQECADACRKCADACEDFLS